MYRRISVALLAAVLLLFRGPGLCQENDRPRPHQRRIRPGRAAVNERHWNAGIESLTKVIDNPATPRTSCPWP